MSYIHSPGGISNTRPIRFLNSHRIRSVCVFLFSTKLENFVGPTFSYVQETVEESCRSYILKIRNHGGQIRSVFLMYGFCGRPMFACRNVDGQKIVVGRFVGGPAFAEGRGSGAVGCACSRKNPTGLPRP